MSVMSGFASHTSAQGTLPVNSVNYEGQWRERNQGESSNKTKPVTLTLKNVSLDAALKAISQQSGVSVVYTEDIVPLKRVVSLQVKEADVVAALRDVLRGTDIVPRVISPTRIALVKAETPQNDSTAQQKVGVLGGRIVDSATQKGVEGATITLVGTKHTVTSTREGGFILRDVPVGRYQLHVRMFGYQAVTRPVVIDERQGGPVVFHMVPVPTVLSGVVTTITGHQRRVEISNDVTAINVDSVMRVAPIRSVTDLLENRVPGLQVLRTTGTPGDPSRLRIRGAGSINGDNAPIVIVDGIRVYAPDSNVNAARRGGPENRSGSLATEANRLSYPAPSPLDQIDPNTIEKIEVFKGPSASAMYGADAAGGVIIITTKRGRPGETRTNVSLNMGTSSIPGRFPENLFLLGHEVNSPSLLCTFIRKCEIDSIVQFQALNDRRFSPIGRGNSLGFSGTVSGGTNLYTYSFTGTASRENGTVRLPSLAAEYYQRFQKEAPPSWMRNPDRNDQYGGTGSFALTPNPLFSITFRNALSYNRQRRSSLGLEAGSQLLNRYILPDGREFQNRNFFLSRFYERATADNTITRHDVSVNWSPRLALPPLNLRAGINPTNSEGTTYIPAGLNIPSIDTSGSYSFSRGTVTTYTLGGNTIVPIEFRSGIRLNLGIGGDVSATSRANEIISTRSLPKGVEVPETFLSSYTSVQKFRETSSTGGFYLSPELRLGSQLFLNTALRFDGGSASGDRAGLMGMPKIGVSWLVIDPSSGGAWPFSSVLSLVKLRGAFGTAGIQPNPTQHLRIYRDVLTQPVPGLPGATGYELFSVGNTRLIPERVSEMEGGFDAGLFNDRMTINMTMYRKMTQDAIIEVDLPASVGTGAMAGKYSVNVGNVKNTGIEFSMSSRILELPSVQWSINTAYSQRSNRLVSLAKGMDHLQTNYNDRRIVVGYPLWGIWARPLGSYGDLNDDGIIQPNEVTLADSAVYVGVNEPKYTWNFSTSVTTWNGRLSMNAAFSYQDKFTQENRYGQHGLLQAANRPGAPLRAQAVAMTTSGPNFSGGSFGGRSYYLYETISVFRFTAFSIGYQLPKSVATLFRARIADLSLQGNNIAFWSNYSGYDPNVNGFSAGNLSGDFGQLPQPRQWSLRLNLVR
jgi:TonB-dependent SusC/RagA subfamily outer membrane receptor